MAKLIAVASYGHNIEHNRPGLINNDSYITVVPILPHTLAMT